jgi:hypothetical protein
MELRIWKRVFITPFIRLNLYTRGFSVSFGHRGLGWITLGKRGIRETLNTPIPGVYLSEGQQWKDIAAASARKRPTAAPVEH